MKTVTSLCVVGDIFLDTLSYLPGFDVSNVELGTDLWMQNTVETLVGGTAIHIAKAAMDLGYSSVNLLGKVGCNSSRSAYDTAGMLVKAYLDEVGITHYLASDVHNATGSSIMLYFKDNFRVMVSHRGANASFGVEDITDEALSLVRCSDILFISGYMLLNDNSALAIVKLMHEAKKSGTFIALDLVPHRLYTLIDKETFRGYTRYVDLIISNFNTIKHFIDGTEAEHTIDTITKELLRFHFGVILSTSVDSLHIFDRTGYTSYELTGYTDISIEQRRGYLDKLTLAYLRPMAERFL